MLLQFCNYLWGNIATTDDMLNPTMNDKLYIFGLMAKEIFCDNMDLIIRGKGKASDRKGVSDPKMSVKSVFFVLLQRSMIYRLLLHIHLVLTGLLNMNP